MCLNIKRVIFASCKHLLIARKKYLINYPTELNCVQYYLLEQLWLTHVIDNICNISLVEVIKWLSM